MITDLPQGYKSSKNLLGTRTKYDKLFKKCNENLLEKSYMYLPPYFNDRILRLPGTFQTRWPDTLWTGGTLDTHPSAHPSVDRTKPNNKATVWTQYLGRDDRFYFTSLHKHQSYKFFLWYLFIFWWKINFDICFHPSQQIWVDGISQHTGTFVSCLDLFHKDIQNRVRFWWLWSVLNDRKWKKILHNSNKHQTWISVALA